MNARLAILGRIAALLLILVNHRSLARALTAVHVLPSLTDNVLRASVRVPIQVLRVSHQSSSAHHTAVLTMAAATNRHQLADLLVLVQRVLQVLLVCQSSTDAHRTLVKTVVLALVKRLAHVIHVCVNVATRDRIARFKLLSVRPILASTAVDVSNFPIRVLIDVNVPLDGPDTIVALPRSVRLEIRVLTVLA